MPPTRRTDAPSEPESPAAQANSTGVYIDHHALQQILAAIAGLTDVIAGSADTGERSPSAEQARVILDYNVLSGLLGRAGRVAPVVSATRAGNVITFLDPIPAGATQVAVTPARGAVEVVPIDLTDRIAVLVTMPQTQPLVRVELQTATGIPVALGPRLPADPDLGE